MSSCARNIAHFLVFVFMRCCAASKFAQFRTLCQPSSVLHSPYHPARPVWYRVQTGAACPAFGRVSCLAWSALVLAPPWFWHGLPCCLCCAVCPGALGLWSPPAGYIAAAQPRPVSLSTTEKIKKAQKITPPTLSISKIPLQKQKDPYKGSVFCAILALQALKGRNMQ